MVELWGEVPDAGGTRRKRGRSQRGGSNADGLLTSNGGSRRNRGRRQRGGGLRWMANDGGSRRKRGRRGRSQRG